MTNLKAFESTFSSDSPIEIHTPINRDNRRKSFAQEFLLRLDKTMIQLRHCGKSCNPLVLNFDVLVNGGQEL